MTDLKYAIDNFGGRSIQLHPDNEEVQILMFADDIVLIADTPTGLTRHVNALSDLCCTKMDMSVNLNKTKAVVFRKVVDLSTMKNVSRWKGNLSWYHFFI